MQYQPFLTPGGCLHWGGLMAHVVLGPVLSLAIPQRTLRGELEPHPY